MGSAAQIRTIVWRGGLHALALLALAGLLWRGRAFLQLLAIAAVLAAAASVPVGALERRRWRRGLAILAVVGGATVVTLGLVAALVPVVAGQVQSFASSLPELIDRVRGSAVLAWVERRLDVDGRGSSLLGGSASTLADAAVTAVSGTANALTGIVIVLAITAFLLTSGPPLWAATLQWVHPDRRPRLERLGSAVRGAVAGYVAGALVMAALAGAVTAVTALLLGVSYWVPLAVATTMLGVVPFVGAIVSGVLVVATTFVTAGQTQGIIALVVFVAYQQIEGTVLQPLVQRRTIELNPAVVLGSVLLGTAAAGIFGGVLALPLAAAAKVLAADALEQRRARWRRARSRSAVAPTDEPRLVERPPPH